MAKTVFEAYNNCKKQLKNAGIEDYVFESKQIIKHITGLDNVGILNNPYKVLSEFEENNLTVIIKQRSIHYPLQYILGEWEFYGNKFFVGPGALIPRQDTETLVTTALNLSENIKKMKVLDLCAGTGCIGISIAKKRKDASVLMLEKYDTALYFANKNIQYHAAHNAVAVKGDIFGGDFSDRKFDLIVSNPPYLNLREMKQLQAEVAFEPKEALAGGKRGLEFYKAILDNYITSLNNGGIICFEVGATQGLEVAKMLKSYYLRHVSIVKDSAGKHRVVFGTYV